MSWHISKAMMEVYGTSLSSLEQEAAYSEASSSDGVPFVPSKSSRTPVLFCAKDKTMDYSRLSRFGMTCEPLTALLGAGLLTWYREDFLVKISPAPEREKESKESGADSGVKWHELSARYDRDTHGWKTHQCLWEEDLQWSSGTLPTWGMMRSGVLCQRRPPVRLTSEKGSGCWATPLAQDAKHSGYAKSGPGMADKLSYQVVKWPTPTTQDAKNNGAQSQQKPNTKPLNAEVGGSLNPTWVEWLMGWPLGWTDLKPLETARCRKQWPWPGVCSAVL